MMFRYYSYAAQNSLLLNIIHLPFNNQHSSNFKLHSQNDPQHKNVRTYIGNKMPINFT